jgi:hypothetical protein
MRKLGYLVIFVAFSALIGTGLLFLVASSVVPERVTIAAGLLAVGTIGAGATAYSYSRWYGQQPAVLAARITDLADRGDGEIAISQVMSALRVPASAVQAAMDDLVQKGQAHAESRNGQMLYVFPGLKERKMVRKCVYCGSTFPVKQPLQKCPNCGGNLELMQQ